MLWFWAAVQEEYVLGLLKHEDGGTVIVPNSWELLAH
jgi:hypothetical protein